jgi:DNA-binding IclR family transcriptional regulator
MRRLHPFQLDILQAIGALPTPCTVADVQTKTSYPSWDAMHDRLIEMERSGYVRFNAHNHLSLTAIGRLIIGKEARLARG